MISNSESSLQQKYKSFLGSKLYVVPVLGACVGVSSAYYKGESMVRRGVMNSLLPTCWYVLFMATTFTINEIRGCDEPVNYMLSGFASTAFFVGGATRNAKLALGTSVAASILGSIYKVGGDYIYNVGREEYINRVATERLRLRKIPQVQKNMKFTYYDDIVDMKDPNSLKRQIKKSLEKKHSLPTELFDEEDDDDNIPMNPTIKKS